MASERRVVSQQLLWVLELNWQFVILIALTLLHPGRSEFGQGEVPGNQFMDYLSFTSLSFPNPLALTPFHSPLLLWLCFSSVILSLQRTDILLGRDFHYLRSGAIYQRMGSSHLLLLTESLFLYWVLHSSIPPFLALSRPMTSLKTCSHTGPSSFPGIHSFTDESLCAHSRPLLPSRATF